ncbi:MAG: InlB B-repeat-containing protein [Firmicutes bacterium]|nr:InlB B-repeat-containing protein [Bacillota bacterium]
MKKEKKLLVALCLVFAMIFVIACSGTGSQNGGGNTNGGETNPPKSQTIVMSFDTDGGSEVAPQTLARGTRPQRPHPNPIRTGYAFGNWYRNMSLTERFDFNSTVYDNAVVYARWNSLANGNGNENGGEENEEGETESEIIIEENDLIIGIGESRLILASFIEIALNERQVIWLSSNSNIVSVNNLGVITAHTAGIANIMVAWSYNLSVSASVEITVLEKETAFADVLRAEPMRTPYVRYLYEDVAVICDYLGMRYIETRRAFFDPRPYRSIVGSYQAENPVTNAIENTFLLDLGSVENAFVSELTTPFFYNGVPISFTITETTTETITHSATRTASESVSVSRTTSGSTTANVSTSVKASASAGFFGVRASVSTEISTSLSSSFSVTNSNASTVALATTDTSQQAYAISKSLATAITFGGNGVSHGYYRLAMYAQARIFWLVITSEDNQELLELQTVVVFNGYRLRVDFCPTGTFDTTPKGSTIDFANRTHNSNIGRRGRGGNGGDAVHGGSGVWVGGNVASRIVFEALGIRVAGGQSGSAGVFGMHGTGTGSVPTGTRIAGIVRPERANAVD